MKTGAWAVFGAIFIAGIIGVYQTRLVKVQSGIVRVCTDAGHEGDKIVRREVTVVTAPRWKASRYKVVEEPVVCQKCQERHEKERREAEERAERERREAERQTRIEAIRQKIVAAIGLYGYSPLKRTDDGQILPDNSRNEREDSVRPGDLICLSLGVVNTSDEPVRGLKLLVEPSKDIYLDLPDSEYDGPASREFKRQQRKEFRLLTTSGLPIGRPLNPVNSHYYRSDTYVWPTVPTGFVKHHVHISQKAQPGTDIQLSGYLLYEGEKIFLNTVTIHVMHP